ncbi:uncharacterized membrane protein YbaN (DUF454 family) [Paenibacillus sp. DS2015]
MKVNMKIAIILCIISIIAFMITGFEVWQLGAALVIILSSFMILTKRK